MKLGMQVGLGVGLGPGHIVLDGDSSTVQFVAYLNASRLL